MRNPMHVLIVIVILTFAAPVLAQTNTDVLPPAGWFEGSAPWVLNGDETLPESIDGLPGYVPGDIHVEIEGVVSLLDTWAEARALIEGKAGSMWYLPDPISVEVLPPEGWFTGAVPWVVSPEDTLPEEISGLPGYVPGQIHVEVDTAVSVFTAWSDARAHVEGLAGALWYLPEGFRIFFPIIGNGYVKVATPPAGTCEGSVGWPVKANNELPESSPCEGHGTWVVDIGGAKSQHCWADARTAADGKDATLWHQPWATCPG